MRAIAPQSSPDDAPLPQSYIELIDAVLKKSQKLPDVRRETIRAWLLSRQSWKLWGPVSSLTAKNHIELLKESPPLEAQLLKPNHDASAADKSCDTLSGSLVDLVKFFGKKENAVVYAATSFFLPNPQTITMRIGSDDAHKTWVDGQFLGTAELTRSAFEGNDGFSIAATAGKHVLLLKIAQRSGDWAYVIDAADADGWPIAIFGNQPEPVPEKK